MSSIFIDLLMKGFDKLILNNNYFKINEIGEKEKFHS